MLYNNTVILGWKIDFIDVGVMLQCGLLKAIPWYGM